jgi:hypothetical protein
MCTELPSALAVATPHPETVPSLMADAMLVAMSDTEGPRPSKVSDPGAGTPSMDVNGIPPTNTVAPDGTGADTTVMEPVAVCSVFGTPATVTVPDARTGTTEPPPTATADGSSHRRST